MTKAEFEERKEALLRDANSLGIINTVPDDSFNPDTIELAVKLVRKHAPDIYKEIEERRKSQR